MNPVDKIYIAGHRGLVGSALVRNLQTKGYSNFHTRTHAELDLTNRKLAETVANIVGNQGKLEFDASKPDGTPRKQMNVERLNALGSKANFRFPDPLLFGSGIEKLDSERTDRRMGQAQRAHQSTERDEPAALGLSICRYLVPREYPECTAKTRPGSENLNFHDESRPPKS